MKWLYICHRDTDSPYQRDRTHKHTATLQMKFAALFLSLRWNTLTAHAIEGETGLHHPFSFTSDQTKANSGHRQSKQLAQAG